MFCIKISQRYNEYGEVLNCEIWKEKWYDWKSNVDEIFMHGSRSNVYFRDGPFTSRSRSLFWKDPAKQTELVSMQMRHGPEDAQIGNRNDNNETRGGNNYSTTLSVARTFEDVARLQWRINRNKSKRAKENLTEESYDLGAYFTD